MCSIYTELEEPASITLYYPVTFQQPGAKLLPTSSIFSSPFRALQQAPAPRATVQDCLISHISSASRICIQESKSHCAHYLALCVLQAHFVLWVISSANLLQHSKQQASGSPSHRKQADSFFHTLYFPLHKSQMLRSRINHKKGRLMFKHLLKHVHNPHPLVKLFLLFK